MQFCECLESTEHNYSEKSTKQVQEDKNEETQGPAGRNHKCGAKRNGSNGQTEEKNVLNVEKETTLPTDVG